MKFLFSVSLVLLGCAVHASMQSNQDVGATMNQRAKQHKLQQDFMRAMHSDGKIASAKRKKREAQRKRELMDKLMAAATPRNLEQNNNEYNFEDSYEWMNPVYQQMMEDGVFDLTARSFKYSGCAAIKAFDPDRAAANGNPMVVDTYAVFRLCPEDSCNKYSLTGCGKNYGEYVVEMSTYLQFMLDFYAGHYGAYCEYCFPCDYTYQVMKHQSQGQCYESMNQQEYEYKQGQQQMAWEDYYQQNFGDMSQYNQAKKQYQEQMEEEMESSYQQAQYSNNNSNGGYRKLDGGYYSNYVASYENGDDATSSSNAQNQGNNYGNANGNNAYDATSSSNAQNQGNNYGNANGNSAYSNFMNYNNGDGSGNGNGAYGGAYGQSGNGNGAYGGAYGQQQNGNGNSLYGWMNGGQVNGQAYYNMMNQQIQQMDGVQQYGYINDNGVWVDLCESNGYTDSEGREYDLDCSEYQSKMMTCSDGSLCDQCEYEVDLSYMPCDEYVCKDYYTYCSDLYEPQYKQMYNDQNNDQNNNNNNNNGNNNYQYNYNNNNMYYGNVNGNNGYNNGGYQYQSNGGGNNANQYYDYDYMEQKNQNQLYDFLQCTAYDNEYGQRYYVGPHCGSDHYTISLGVFADENCVEYLGETVSLSKVLGYGYDDESFFHLPHECISCDGASQFAEDEQRYEEMFTGQGVYGEYVEAPNAEFDDVVAMCAALFERSAQCNIHMQNYDMMAKYMEDLDVEFEQLYCNFIDNIVYGAYDELGEIKLRADSFDLRDWRNPEQYKKMRMPAGQAVGLALSILLVIALSTLAFVTQRSLVRRGSTPWKPKRKSKKGSLDRQESGIEIGGSQSGPVNPPLI